MQYYLTVIWSSNQASFDFLGQCPSIWVSTKKIGTLEVFACDNSNFTCTLEAKKIKTKTKTEGPNRQKKPREINICSADTYNEVNKPMLIKQTPISVFTVWV